MLVKRRKTELRSPWWAWIRVWHPVTGNYLLFLGGVEVPDEPEHQTALEIEKLQGQVQGDPDHDYDYDKSNDGFDEEGEITLLSKSRWSLTEDNFVKILKRWEAVSGSMELRKRRNLLLCQSGIWSSTIRKGWIIIKSPWPSWSSRSIIFNNRHHRHHDFTGMIAIVTVERIR